MRVGSHLFFLGGRGDQAAYISPMRILAILIILAAFPACHALVRSPHARRWAFVGLGALPMLYVPLNLDASLISWPLWPGHTRGFQLTVVDPLALAICLRWARKHPWPPLLLTYGIYLLCLVPGLLLGRFLSPGLFFVFQVFRVTIFFYAVYLSVLEGQLTRVAEGLALATIASGCVSLYHAHSGVIQAQGILGHQNLSGLATNLCIPLLLALGLRTKRNLLLFAVVAGAIGALAGGSRATMVLLALTMSGTIATTVLLKPSARTAGIGILTAVALAAAAPFAIHKLNERDVAGFELDPERLAFDRTAKLMIKDYPWGVGLDQYVNVANEFGYFDRGGVRWGSGARSTSVHNAYLLTQAEAGLIGLCGFLIWLLGPVLLAAVSFFRSRIALREVSVASGFAIFGAALHSRYEWVLVTATPQYLVALSAGVIAALSAFPSSSVQARRKPLPKRPRTGDTAWAAQQGSSGDESTPPSTP